MALRDKTVDSLRGIACILLVTMHTAQSTAAAQGAVGGAVEWYAESLVPLRMPLFAFLAGVVYAWRPLDDRRAYGAFIGKKVQRLLVPYVIFVPIVAVAHIALGFGNQPPADEWRWFVYSWGPYWFLLATFWVYAAVALIDSFGLLARFRNVAILFAGLLAVAMSVDLQLVVDPLQLASAVYLGLFFTAGLAATRFGWRDMGRAHALGAAGVTIALLLHTQLVYFGAWSIAPNPRQDILGISLGIAFPMAFIGLGLKSSALAWIGNYSSGIFLLHPLTMAAARGVLHVLGVDSVLLDVVATSAAGLVGSVACIVVMRRAAIGRIALGERTKVPAMVPRRPRAE